MNVGIRDLKAHLSQYIEHARQGEELIITDRGKPVARIEPVLSPVPSREIPEAIRHLVESGRMIDKGPLRDLPTPIRMTLGERTSTDFVRVQRR